MRLRLNPLSSTGVDIEPEDQYEKVKSLIRRSTGNAGGTGYVGYTGPKITVSQTAPTGATTGDLWVDTN